MKLKTAKILKVIARNLASVDGVKIPFGTRVVLMSHARETKRAGVPTIKAFVSDPFLPKLENEVVIAPVAAFAETHAGRPPKTQPAPPPPAPVPVVSRRKGQPAAQKPVRATQLDLLD